MPEQHRDRRVEQDRRLRRWNKRRPTIEATSVSVDMSHALGQMIIICPRSIYSDTSQALANLSDSIRVSILADKDQIKPHQLVSSKQDEQQQQYSRNVSTHLEKNLPSTPSEPNRPKTNGAYHDGRHRICASPKSQFMISEGILFANARRPFDSSQTVIGNEGSVPD